MNPPQQLLKNLFWNFNQDKFSSQQDFENDLINYNELISKEKENVDLSEIILNCPKIVVQYSYWDEEEDDDIELDFLVEANNASNFTTGELLFKIHNEFCKSLANDDHIFFEGLELWKEGHPDFSGVPFYFLLQGS